MAEGIFLGTKSDCLGLPQIQGRRAHSCCNYSAPHPAYRPVINTVVAQVFEIKLDDLSRQSRGRANVAFARQVAMYLAHVACGLTFTDIGNLFGRDRTTVAHACSLVEDKRDDLLFDMVLELLENAVLSMLCFERYDQSTDEQDYHSIQTSTRESA